MKRTSVVVILAFVLSAVAAQTSSAQDQQKAMEAFMKAAAVTSSHAALKFFVGKWDVASTMWATPGAPATTSKNTIEAALILGGRYVQMNYRGTMMGQPFEGIQITGYDNMQKAYETFWIDNTSTSFYFLSGTYDQARKIYTMKGKWADPLGGMTPVRMVIRIVSPDEYVSATYMTLPDGKDFKSMEDRTVRKK